MKDPQTLQSLTQGRLARRDFLKAAAALAGTSVLALTSKTAKADPGQGSPIRMGFWNGERFVDPSTLPSGDPTLIDVVLQFRGYGEASSLRAVEVLASVPQAKSMLEVPFTAWVAPPNGAQQTRFKMPVADRGGLKVRALVRSKSSDVPVEWRFAQGTGPEAKLHPGSYVWVTQFVDWDRLGWQQGNPDAPLRNFDGSPAAFPYLVLTLERP